MASINSTIGYGAAPAVSDRISELSSALNGLDNAVTDLGNAAEILSQRLAPVTSQYAASAKPVASDNAPRQAPSCITVGRIQDLTERLYAIRNALGEQHDALVV